MPRYEGRLELTWTNKHLRLLHDTGTAGAVAPDDERACDNLLIHGDALNALTSLIELPEFAADQRSNDAVDVDLLQR